MKRRREKEKERVRRRRTTNETEDDGQQPESRSQKLEARSSTDARATRRMAGQRACHVIDMLPAVFGVGRPLRPSSAEQLSAREHLRLLIQLPNLPPCLSAARHRLPVRSRSLSTTARRFRRNSAPPQFLLSRQYSSQTARQLCVGNPRYWRATAYDHTLRCIAIGALCLASGQAVKLALCGDRAYSETSQPPAILNGRTAFIRHPN